MIPDQYYIDLALMLLREPTLFNWNHREEWLGHERRWIVFTGTLDACFCLVDNMDVWNLRAKRFNQLLGETIPSYTVRFCSEIVDKCPALAMTDLLHMQIYS